VLSGMDGFMNNEKERLSLHVTDSMDETFNIRYSFL
jgi:hypothetical protein